MNTHRGMAAVCLALMVAMGLACNQQQTAKKKGAAEGAGAKEGAPGASASEGGSCDDYSKQLCDKLGETSPSCNAAKQTTDLMPAAACKAGLADMAFTETKIKELGKVCKQLADKLCKDLGEDTQSCSMVREQTPKFPPERCTSMMGQYDAVLADLKKREEANKPLTDDKRKKIEENAVAVFGPENAKVTIVEFSDFQCPFCSRAATAVSEIKKQYEGKDVRFIFRQFPLNFHKQAHLAAQASMAAAEQGKFWEFHDTLFENQRELERPKLEEYAKKVGLDLAKFKKALDDGAHKEAVDADYKLGEEVAVSGTPTMFVNGARVANPTDSKALATEIDKALAN